jgi:Uma2 family endonuclease
MIARTDMAQPATKRLTFEEFQELNLDGAYELVDGQLEELVPPKPRHGWTGARLSIELGNYLDIHEPEAYYGVEVDIPTIPSFGRRPDFLYYAPAEAARIDLDANRVLGVPTLVVEVVSEEDEARDTVTKRREYAEAGIQYYWIVDPQRRAVLTLVLRDTAYEVAGEFSGEAMLTSTLFPGLEIPLARLFRS